MSPSKQKEELKLKYQSLELRQLKTAKLIAQEIREESSLLCSVAQTAKIEVINSAGD